MRQFSVDEKLVCDWWMIKYLLISIPWTKRARRGNVSSFPDLEEELYKWVMSQRQEGYIVTRGWIRLPAVQLKKNEKYKNLLVISTFLASTDWCSKFMDRKSLTLRQRTKIAQKLPAVLEEKIESFHRFVIKNWKNTSMIYHTLVTWTKSQWLLISHPIALSIPFEIKLYWSQPPSFSKDKLYLKMQNLCPAL